MDRVKEGIDDNNNTDINFNILYVYVYTMSCHPSSFG